MAILDSYSLDYEVFNKIADLDSGEWMIVSYKADNRRNVSIFISMPNKEQKII